MLAITSTGDAFALAALLGILAADLLTWGSATLVAVGLLARWGTSSLRAVSGAQAVLGPAVLVGDARLAAASWLMGAALVVVSPPGMPVLAFGSAAALVVAGPSPGAGAVGIALRAASAVLAIGIAFACARWVPRRLARWGSLAFATTALILLAPGALQ